MRYYKSVVKIVFCLFAVCLISLNGDYRVKAANAVSINKIPNNKITLLKGKSKSIKCSSVKCKVTNNNKKIVKISKKGKIITIKGVKRGKASFYVTQNGKKKKIQVVVQEPVAKIKINNTINTMYVGDTLKLSVTVTPANAGNKTIIWTASNNNVTIDSNGNVKANKCGKCEIKASSTDGSNKSAKIIITISEKNNIDSISVFKDEVFRLELKQPYKLTKNDIACSIKTFSDSPRPFMLQVVKIHTNDNKVYYIDLNTSQHKEGAYFIKTSDLVGNILVFTINGLNGTDSRTKYEYFVPEREYKEQIFYFKTNTEIYDYTYDYYFTNDTYECEISGDIPEGLIIKEKDKNLYFTGKVEEPGFYEVIAKFTFSRGQTAVLKAKIIVESDDEITVEQKEDCVTEDSFGRIYAAKAIYVCGGSGQYEYEILSDNIDSSKVSVMGWFASSYAEIIIDYVDEERVTDEIEVKIYDAKDESIYTIVKLNIQIKPGAKARHLYTVDSDGKANKDARVTLYNNENGRKYTSYNDCTVAYPLEAKYDIIIRTKDNLIVYNNVSLDDVFQHEEKDGCIYYYTQID